VKKLPSVWNKRVDPASDPRFSKREVKPVTWKDLENQVHTLCLRRFEMVKIGPKGRIEDFRRPPRYGGSYGRERLRVIRLKEALDLHSELYDFGRVITLKWNIILAENFKEVVDEIARRNLYLCLHGYVPTCIPEALWHAEFQPPPKVHRYLLERLGSRFLGWENGEQDGRYVAAYAKMYCPAPLTRRQAYDYFLKYFRRLCNDLRDYVYYEGTLPTFAHYFADMGNHRLLGAEIGGRGNMSMWFTFIRGAGKQYGILWFSDISLWNICRGGALNPELEEDLPDGKVGPTRGVSIQLLKRLLYIAAMYDCCMVLSFEFGHLSCKRTVTRLIDGKLRKVPDLTALGKLQLEFKDWLRRHPDHGVMYTPIALILDFYHGWAPPRHYYPWRGEPYLIWGNMPYRKGDHQIDLFFREVFPGYEDASFYHDERGILTPTPYGDIFDVLLSNVPEFILNRYNAAVVLGETYIEGEFLEKIRKFVEAGGSLAVFANQLRDDAEDLLGIRLLGSTKHCDHSVLSHENLMIYEPTFTMHEIEVAGAEVLATTRHGEPLVTSKRHSSGGKVLVFAADYGLSDHLDFHSPIYNEPDRPLPSPYQLLRHVHALLFPWLREFNLVEVIGPPIQYITSVTKDPSRLLLTLCNNDAQPWFGNVKIKGANIARAVNWMTDKPLQGGSHLNVKVAPYDVVILELYADRPVFRSKGIFQ